MGVKVKILFFASAREMAGEREVQADIPSSRPHVSPREVREYLRSRYEGLGPIVEDVTLAVNMEYVQRETENALEIRSGDEVALIPPISGG
jgi:molybdopterin converting factor subunit 1